MKDITFRKEAFDQLNEWINIQPKVVNKIWELIKIIQRTPFEGKGNPEPLKHQFAGFWSRRIIDEHRLIYKITAGDDVIIISCKGHYTL